MGKHLPSVSPGGRFWNSIIIIGKVYLWVLDLHHRGQIPAQAGIGLLEDDGGRVDSPAQPVLSAANANSKPVCGKTFPSAITPPDYLTGGSGVPAPCFFRSGFRVFS
jgi:hypothetical protein